MDGALLDEFGIGDAQARAESWRYSKAALRALEQNEFVAADPAAQLPLDLAARFDWPETREHRIVFINGALSFEHSDHRAAGEFRLLGDRIRLTQGARMHAVYVSIATAAAARWRHEVPIQVLGSAEFIEHHLGVAGTDVLGSVMSRVILEPGASLNFTTISDLPDSTSLYGRKRVEIGADAAYSSMHVLCGGRLQRYDLDIELAGARAQCGSRGVFALRGRQHVDVQLGVRHAARDTRSDVLWRGIADMRGRGILRGAITVAAGADGSDARLQTKNLLLAPHAQIDVQPVLEIHADEVKASHGATVGQLDERALFYLRSRGLPAATARNLLIAGFCRDALDSLDNDQLRARAEALLAERLPQTGGDAQ